MNNQAPPGFVKMGNRIVPAQANFGQPRQKTRRFLIVLQYYAGDQAAVEQLGSLIAALERTRNHDADILIWGRFDAPQFSPTVIAQLQAKFGAVRIERCRRRDGTSYPYAANNMFHDMVGQFVGAPWIMEYFAFINLESDCTPTRPGWIGELIAGFKAATTRNKFVIGFLENDPRPHVNGVAVYAIDIRKRAGHGLLGCGPNVCYDIAAANMMLPLAEATPLIHFKYRQPTITPEELFAVRNGVAPAIYHGVKDQSARAAVRARHISFTDRASAQIITHAPSTDTLKLSDAMTQGFSADGEAAARLGVKDSILAHEYPESRRTQPLGVSAAIAAEEGAKARVKTDTPYIQVDHSVPVKPPLDAAPKRPNAYTYYSARGRQSAESQAVLEAWRKGWASRGWNPVVLTLRDAAKHPRFDEFSKAIEKLPCAMDRSRTAHRFNRWLALEGAGGGLLVDCDVLPADFTPDALGDMPVVEAFRAEPQGRFFGAYFNAAKATEWINTIIAYDAQPDDKFGAKADVTDDTILRRFHPSDDSSGALVHFSSATVGNERKSAAMEKFLAAPPAVAVEEIL